MKAITLFLICVLGLSACQPASQLAGTSWELTSYGEIDSPMPVLSGESPTLEFHVDGSFAAHTGCNSAGGSYKESGNRIEFNDLISTLMACAEADRAVQEAAYVDGLNKAQEFDFKDGQLLIYYESHTKALVFSQTP